MILLNTKEKDLKYIMHTYGRYDVALKSGKGAVAYDENGKKYIDVSSGIGVNSLGYCNEGWVEAVTKQAGTIQHMPNYFYSEQSSNLAEKAIEMIKSQGIDKTHIFCYQNNETGQSFWRDFGFNKREDVFVYSFDNDKIGE